MKLGSIKQGSFCIHMCNSWQTGPRALSRLFRIQLNHVMRKPALCHLRTTKTQISLRNHAVWSSATLLFATPGSISSTAYYGRRNPVFDDLRIVWVDVTFSRSSSCAYPQKLQELFICVDSRRGVFCVRSQKLQYWMICVSWSADVTFSGSSSCV